MFSSYNSQFNTITGEFFMKKTLLTLLGVAIIPATLLGKNIEERTIELKGDANLLFASIKEDTNGNDSDYDVTNLDFEGLYYIARNLGVGLHWDYSSFSGDRDGSTTIFGPQMAYNISINPDTSVKLLGGLRYVTGEDGNKNDFDGTEWEMGAGVSYFIRNNISINGSIEYTKQDIDYDNNADETTSGFSTGFGLSVYF